MPNHEAQRPNTLPSGGKSIRLHETINNLCRVSTDCSILLCNANKNTSEKHTVMFLWLWALHSRKLRNHLYNWKDYSDWQGAGASQGVLCGPLSGVWQEWKSKVTKVLLLAWSHLVATMTMLVVAWLLTGTPMPDKPCWGGRLNLSNPTNVSWPSAERPSKLGKNLTNKWNIHRPLQQHTHSGSCPIYVTAERTSRRS